MFRIEKIILNSGLISLIGFAKKSREVDAGLQALRRGVLRGKTSFVLVDQSTSSNTIKKIIALAEKYRLPVFIVSRGSAAGGLIGVSGNKILGMHQGALARGFFDKLKQENQ